MSVNNSRSSSISTSSSTHASDGSQRHSSKRRSLNTIESSVTRLLVSTKHLLESLTQWARQEADDKYVSDAYVKLGNDFRTAIRAFGNNGIDTSDIGNVPQALRIILEAALSEAPSQENLDKFLPGIRNIIVTLLQTLKANRLKQKQSPKKEQARRSLSLTIQAIIVDLVHFQKRKITSKHNPQKQSMRKTMPCHSCKR